MVVGVDLANGGQRRPLRIAEPVFEAPSRLIKLVRVQGSTTEVGRGSYK
jgi:hypothetical protein